MTDAIALLVCVWMLALVIHGGPTPPRDGVVRRSRRALVAL